MAIFKDAWNYIKKSVSGLATPERWFKESLGIEETAAGVDVTPEGALACSAVAACTRLLSESVASLPLHVFEQADSDKRKAPDHPLYWVLHDRPNDYQTSFMWRQQLMAHVLLHGNSYNVIERDSSGRITALWPLVPQNVVVKVKDGTITYEHFVGSQRELYPFEQVLHIKGPSLNGITGMSIVQIAKQGIGLALAQDNHGAATFKNRARPGLVVKCPHALSDAARANIKDQFAEKFTGALNSGKTIVLENGWDVASVGFSNEDAQYLQSKQFSIQEIARWFRVSPTMIGDLSRSTYSNSEQEQLSFLQHSLRPWLVNIESEINCALFARSKYFAEFDMSAVARGDLATRYDAYEKGLRARFLTVADVRRWENLPFIAGTDMLPADGGKDGQPTV
ncbi:MAG TPA: phage portal protein [Candidatus Nanoarchaeia archaeon]|nr:phage portal protein [Candidatus Nanoarchaeia archaeon]